MPILEQHHLLLVTLLVANSAAAEALPIFLNKLVPELVAIIISVTAILIFSEIVPQAVCTGPNQIRIAAAAAPATKTLMMMMGFIAYPISKILDGILGEHTQSRYKNSDLKALIELHTQDAMREMEEKKRDSVGLSKEQSKLIHGAIDLTSVTAKDAMTPYNKVEVIDCKQILSQEFLKKLSHKGYSRYPVYKDTRQNVIGILLVKKLLGLRVFDKSLEAINIPLRTPLIVLPTMPLTDLLMEFQKGKSHIALVTDQIAELKKNMGLDTSTSMQQMGFEEAMDSRPIIIMGIVTLEDVVERALGEYANVVVIRVVKSWTKTTMTRNTWPTSLPPHRVPVRIIGRSQTRPRSQSWRTPSLASTGANCKSGFERR